MRGPIVIRVAMPAIGVAAVLAAAGWWVRTRTGEAEGRTRERLTRRRAHVAASAAGIEVA